MLSGSKRLRIGYCLAIPKGRHLYRRASHSGPTASVRLSSREPGATPSIVKTYSGLDLGIAATLATGGALSTNGVYSHAVILGAPSFEIEAASSTPWWRRFHVDGTVALPTGMQAGIITLNSTTGDLLHTAKMDASAPFLHYV